MATRTRRSFPEEFKAEAVRLAHSSPNLAAVARNLDIDVSTLRDWVRRAAQPQKDSDSLSLPERQELVQLRRENAVLKMEREILKKATAFFAKESR
jgi:transposase